MRMSEEEYAGLLAKKAKKANLATETTKPSKHRNVKTTIDGITFDSAKEARRWQDLCLWQASGQITQLLRQQRFKIVVNGVHICDYIADVTYREHGKLVVEDTKSAHTRKMDVYRLKKKLMLAVHKIEIREV